MLGELIAADSGTMVGGVSGEVESAGEQGNRKIVGSFARSDDRSA
jgi:hypothetical protein